MACTLRFFYTVLEEATYTDSEENAEYSVLAFNFAFSFYVFDKATDIDSEVNSLQ